MKVKFIQGEHIVAREHAKAQVLGYIEIYYNRLQLVLLAFAIRLPFARFARSIPGGLSAYSKVRSKIKTPTRISGVQLRLILDALYALTRALRQNTTQMRI